MAWRAVKDKNIFAWLQIMIHIPLSQLHLKRILNTNKDVNIYYYYALILMIFFSDITQVLHSNRILYKPTRLYWINRTFQFAELVLGIRGVKTELSRKFSSHGSANGEPNMSSLVDQGLKVPMQCNQLSTLNWKLFSASK